MYRIRYGLLALVLFVAEIPSAQGAGPKARRVEFGTSDGVRIVSDYYRANAKRSAPVIILLHMYGENRSSWGPLIDPLHEAGFAILAMDLRGHGESIEPTSQNLAERVAKRDAKLFRHMYQDVMGAYVWLWKQSGIDMSRIGLVGASVGCSVAIDYAGRDKSVDVLVCMTPGRRYLGIDSNKGMAKIGPRWGLFLASEAERGDAEYLASQGEHVEAKIFPQGSYEADGLHGTRMFGNIAGVEKVIVDFLEEHIGKATVPQARVVASINSNVYHSPESSIVKRIHRENLRAFSSAAEAQSRGMRASKR